MNAHRKWCHTGAVARVRQGGQQSVHRVTALLSKRIREEGSCKFLGWLRHDLLIDRACEPERIRRLDVIQRGV
jgi:hypothetical protein